MGKHVSITTHGDGGGGNKISISEDKFIDTRTNEQTGKEEALVEVGGDGGGKATEWHPVRGASRHVDSDDDTTSGTLEIKEGGNCDGLGEWGDAK